MAFIITFIALLVERFFDWSHVRRWRWFGKCLQVINQRMGGWPTWLLLALAVVPPVLIVGVLNHYLAGVLYGVLKLLFGLFMLIYCLGPANFWAQAYQCLGVQASDDLTLAFDRARSAFGVVVCDSPQAFHRAFTNALFVEANRRVFAVLFWFIVAGPAGALLYRLLDVSRASGLTLARPAEMLLGWLDWFPVRLFTLCFALGGHFTKVIQHWRHDVLTWPKMNNILLSECGVASLDVLEAERIPEDGTAEKETLHLLDRVFVIALVVVAIVVLA